jgi:hypothetical protein
MAIYTISQFAGIGAQLFDDNGVPLSGGKIFTYAAGTTTPLTTYTTSAGNIAHTNPIVLNAAGRVSTGEIWVDATQTYKFVVKTSTNVLIATYDNIGGGLNSTTSLANFTGNGLQTEFSLAFSPINENTTQIYINGIYQQKNTYDLNLSKIVFSEAPPITSSIEVLFI